MRLPAPKDDQQASPDSHWSKRRRLDDQEQHFNLAEILVTCTRDGKTHSVPLVSFIPSNLLNIEKPQVYQFSYDLLRTWLETCCGMPPETPLAVLLHASDGSPNTSIVENKWNFAKVLHRIWNGTCVVPYDAELKFYLPVADACDTPNAAKDDLPQDPVPAAQKEDDQAATDQPRAPVLDLTKDDSDDDQVEDAADEAHLLIGFDPKKWNMTRRMFQLDQVPERREAKYRLRGIARPPHMYQLITVWNILTNPITTGVSGLMIGWDVGFGKTMLTLVFLRIRAELAMQWVEVKREWEAAKKGGLVERRHWPEGAQEPQSRCPSYVPTYHKGVLEGSIQCPCVPGSQSREICEWYLTNTPALIVLPAGLIPNWLEEAAKVYADMDPNDADSDPLMTFLVYSSDLKSKNGEIVLPRPKNTRGWKEISDTKGGQVVSSDEYGTEELLFISGGSGIARDIFIASSAAVDRMLKCFNEADTYYSQWKKIKTRILTVGAFVMDEFHLYKGTNDATLAFNHLKTIAGCANHPVSLITLCGTTLEEGPSAFQHVIQHFVNQHKKFRNGDNDLRCIDKHGYRVTNEQFEKMKQLFRSAVQGLGFQGRSVEEIKKELAPCVSFCRQFMDCLRRGQKYRGKPIDPLPPLYRVREELEPLMDEETSRRLKEAMASVNTLVDNMLKSRVQSWKDGSREGEPPTRQLLMEELRSGESKPKGNEHEFSLLQRSSMYPYLLCAQDRVDKAWDAMKNDKCQKIASTVQREILQKHKPPFKALQEALATWDWLAVANDLMRSSAKLRHIKKLIKDMINDQNPATAPVDGSGKRHAIIFFSQGISAALTYVFLLHDQRLRERVELFFLSSSESMEERTQIIGRMQEKCGSGSKNKVLLAMASVAGEGFNIQRVNNVWFPELPITLSKAWQAEGRAYRQGQKAPVTVVTMVEKGNELELLGYDAMKAKMTAAKIIYGVDLEEN